MMRRWLLYILFVFLLVSSQVAYAMPFNSDVTVADTINVADSTVTSVKQSKKEVYRADNYGVDARKFAFQGRYRIPPMTPEYSNSNFFSHLYFGGGISIEHINRRGRYRYGDGVVYNLTIGKDISKSHSLSAAFRWGENTVKNSDIHLDRWGVQLNHYFSLTRYFLEYNPKRTLDVSTILGIGYQRANLADPGFHHDGIWKLTTDAVYGMVGLRTTVRLANRFHLAIDPYMIIASAGYNGMVKGDTKLAYNASYGVGLSLIYTMKNELSNDVADGKRLFDKNYIFFEGGPQAVYSNITFSESLGRYFAIGYGHWFARNFAFQLSGGYSSGGWSRYRTPADLSAGHPEYTYIAKVQYFFGRAELVANLLTLPLKKDVKKFHLGLSGGYEYGFQWKYTDKNTNVENHQTSCVYGGLTTALQVKWLLPQGKALYLSPRVTFVNFGVPYKEPYDFIEKEYTDKRFSLALGLEFGLKRRPYEKREGDEQLYKFKENGKIRYRQGLCLSASFGSNYIFDRGYYKGESTFNINAALSFEYQPIKYFGLRVKADYTTHNFNDMYGYIETVDGKTYSYNGLWRITYKTINGMFDVKFDLTNMIHGYDPHNKWNVALYAGPMISKHIPLSAALNEDELQLPGSTVQINMGSNEDILLGIHAAFNCKYFITRHIGVFGEFGVKIHPSNNLYLWAPKIDYNPLRVLDLEFGVCYKIR